MVNVIVTIAKVVPLVTFLVVGAFAFQVRPVDRGHLGHQHDGVRRRLHRPGTAGRHDVTRSSP